MRRAIFLIAGLLIIAPDTAPPAWAQRYEVPGVKTAPTLRQPGAVRPAITGGRVACVGYEAAGYFCQNVDLLSFLPIRRLGGEGGVRLNDLWGWTDPQTGKEYALVGRTDGTAFVDVSDPTRPVYVGELPLTEGAQPSGWRDVKTYEGYAFIVADNAGEHGMQVFDLTELRQYTGEPITFAPDTVYHEIHSAHNIAINTKTGFAYTVGSSGGGRTCGGGLHMIDIRDPLNPAFAGCFADESTGRRGTGYTHDAQCVVYHGPDVEHEGREICFGLNETAVSIADVTDKANPVALAAAPYPQVSYTHQGWLTEDHRYLFANDELDEYNDRTDETRTLIWDVTDLDDPQFVAGYTFGTSSIDHNLYVTGGRMYQTNYTSGLRIHDISTPEEPVITGFFDTTPDVEGAHFAGTWSNYPFFESGVIAVSSIGEGLFLLEYTPPAPNEVVAFEAETDLNDLTLSWATIAEQGNLGFEVQRKVDGGAQWETITFVESRGDAEEEQWYSYVIDDVAPGRYAFRLRQVSEDGSTQRSRERRVHVAPDENPAIFYFSVSAEGGDVRLFWQTASEDGLRGFKVQYTAAVSGGEKQWKTPVFVPKEGNRLPSKYDYVIEDLFPGRYLFRLKFVGERGETRIGPQREVLVGVEGAYALSAVHPNPFSRRAKFLLTLKREQRVRVAVYDALGRRVALLHDGPLPAGEQHRFTLDADARGLASGVYVWRVGGETFTASRTSVLVR